MKRKLKKLLSLVIACVLLLGLAIPALAFDVPDGYWEARAAWFKARDAKDSSAYLKTAAVVYDMLIRRNKSWDFDLCNDMLHPLCAQCSWCCELMGDLDGAAMWLSRQLEADRWLDEHGYTQTDHILNGEARMKHLTRPMEVYALTDKPADVPYYGAKGEPVCGLWYGTVPEVTHQNDSAALIYVQFNDGHTMQHWLDYYCERDSVTNRSLNSGGVVELAWNFKESNAGLDEVLAADSYIKASLAELGSRNCTVFLRPGAEMNGGWPELPDADKFISAYRKIAQEARKYSNIALVFSPQDVNNRNVTYDTYYPGDEWVDWFGVSTYHRGESGEGAYTFDDRAHDNDAFYCVGLYGSDPLIILQDLVDMAKAHKKPMMISECGFAIRSRKTGVVQTSYAADRMNKFYAYLPMLYPQIKAVFFFNNNVMRDDYEYAIAGYPTLASIYTGKVSAAPFIQWGSKTAPSYAKLSDVKPTDGSLTLGTYVSLPGTGGTTVRYALDGVQKGSSSSEPFSLTLTGLTPGKHTLTVTASKGQFEKTITRTITVPGFTDVKKSDYFAEAVQWAKDNNITQGTGETTFSPQDTVTRGQAVTFLWRLKKEPEPKATVNPFTDVKKTDYYYKAVLWAWENGITNGAGDTEFRPLSPVTRGQMITFLWRAQGRPGDTGSAVWYADAEKWAKGKNLLAGTAEAYATDADCPRADVVYYIWRTK
ncbi:MAG: S-layer homology domain-containing protein [Oscillospiraceae bacterium]|nr:S-layer homology domain-containing protein [Oscillospiraceae bacterium]